MGLLPMKKTLLAVTISLSLFGLTACNSENTSKEHIPLELTVAHINDTHAHLDPTENGLAIQPTGQQKFEFFAKLGGYPRLKFKLDELREQAGKDGRHFLTLFGGDAFQGTLISLSSVAKKSPACSRIWGSMQQRWATTSLIWAMAP